MAKKTILGIDVGHDQLKLALVDNGTVLDAVSIPMPDNMLRDGEITSIEAMADLIEKTMKTNGIKAKNAAYVMPNEMAYVKEVSMPMMNAEQLAINLPYEFNDYITGEVKDYVFDYAVLPPKAKTENESEVKPEAESEAENEAEGEEPEQVLRLMAVGAERKYIDDIQKLLARAGLKMVKIAPALCTYISLIRNRMDFLKQTTEEFGILDLGHEAVRMYIFDEDRHEATRVLESGLSTLVDVVAEIYGVERHLAQTYIINNYDNCLEREECRNTYENIATELMRAMNFYKFSNPESNLTDLWLCGGGGFIHPLALAIGEMLDMRLHTASELVDEGDEIPGCNSFVQAIGITLD